MTPDDLKASFTPYESRLFAAVNAFHQSNASSKAVEMGMASRRIVNLVMTNKGLSRAAQQKVLSQAFFNGIAGADAPASQQAKVRLSIGMAMRESDGHSDEEIVRYFRGVFGNEYVQEALRISSPGALSDSERAAFEHERAPRIDPESVALLTLRAYHKEQGSLWNQVGKLFNRQPDVLRADDSPAPMAAFRPKG